MRSSNEKLCCLLNASKMQYLSVCLFGRNRTLDGSYRLIAVKIVAKSQDKVVQDPNIF